MAINRYNVGRIAERIVANELEDRGWRVSDLNRDGTSANADLIAAQDGKIWQIQVKGATNKPSERWWIQYGHCNDQIIDKHEPVFNRKDSFYKAQFVVLVAVKSPTKYRCVIMPTKKAEQAAQINIDRGYRGFTKAGKRKKPSKIWVHLDPPTRKSWRTPESMKSLEMERNLLKTHTDAWGNL